MHRRGYIPPLCPCCHPSTFSTMHPFLGMGSPCECKAIFCRWPIQHQPPGLLPSLLCAWVQICCLNMCFILKVHVLTQRLFTSICSPHDCAFQQVLNHSPVVMYGDPAQSISCPIISSLLIIQSMPIHLCPVASRFGVVRTYINGLLSVLTTNGVYTRYSFKCSVTLHLRARNPSRAVIVFLKERLPNVTG